MNRKLLISVFWCWTISLGCVGDPPDNTLVESSAEPPKFKDVSDEQRDLEATDSFLTFRSEVLAGKVPPVPDSVDRGDAPANDASSNDAGPASEESTKVKAVLVESGERNYVIGIYISDSGVAIRHDSRSDKPEFAEVGEKQMKFVTQYTTMAKNHLAEFKKTETFPLPQDSVTRFYLVTDEGILTSAGFSEDIADPRHPLNRLDQATTMLVQTINE